VFSSTAFVSALLAFSCPLPALARDINWSSLNLTPQQESQIERLEESWEKTHAEVGAQIERDAAELRAILPTGDTQRIRQLQNRITANKMFLMNQSIDTFLRKRETLTPAQRMQLQKMLPAKYHH
jgi:Spy/CpxP family protein refolding chaperone